MKILFTGMASSHCTPSENVSFFNTVAKAVGSFADVVWATPKLSWTKKDLEEFDFIFLGFIPPTALSANKIYGAMHVMGLMFDSPKLRLVVDGQQVWQYKNSIELIKRDISNLFTSFYSKRAEYQLAKSSDTNEYVRLASKHFSSESWPVTYYPTLPWTSHDSAVDSMGFGTRSSFIGLNLDSLLINLEPYTASSRQELWTVDNEKSLWFKKLQLSIVNPVSPLKVSRVLSDVDAATSMRSSLGLIVTPQERSVGTWWSYRYIQALNSNTPVVTDWTSTVKFSDCWSHLAYQVEEMSEAARRSLARDQLDAYQSSIKSRHQTIQSLRENILDLNSERI